MAVIKRDAAMRLSSSSSQCGGAVARTQRRPHASHDGGDGWSLVGGS
jgi:hypothetical protein